MKKEQQLMGSKDQGAALVAGRWLTIPRTLSFVMNAGDVLLIKRAPHKRIFPNKYNGVGGHIERYEDPMTSARREILEETGLTVHDLRLRAIHNIDAGDATGIMLFVFTAISDERNTSDSEEGTLHWIKTEDIPKLDAVEDVAALLSRILEMSPDAPPLFAHVSYNSADELQLRYAE